ncbi:MAG: helix-turn-helix domain-containing protein [Prevotella sp.]|jgi:transcriptional regulator with XRE-family HTH domain|nr:helix-turn-helix domain-containing protein [Prevotella sp.]
MNAIEKNTHHGHAVKRLRHTLGIKQDALAAELGMSQARVSTYESKKVIDDDMIEKFAKALKVSPELIKDLEEDPVTVIIENNTFENKEGNNIAYLEEDNSTQINNPIDQILELSKEKQNLYERMLELEKEKNTLLEKLLREKK